MKSPVFHVPIITLVLFGLACAEQESGWMPLLPEGKADLVIVLKNGITYKEIRRFDEEELIVGDFEKGHEHRPGIAGTMEMTIDGHKAFAVLYDPSATLEQREAILESIIKSIFVYRVFENVAPEDVVLEEKQEVDR